MCRMAVREAQRLLLANRWYNWHVFSRQLSREWQQQLAAHYPTSTAASSPIPADGKMVVSMCNGWVESGGLVDRLRGIVSTYILCRESGLPFRLHFTSPFPLELFLVPNAYDWCIAPDALRFSQPEATPVALQVGSESPWQSAKQREWLQRHIRQASGKQVHVYTNAMFAYGEGFGTAFNELFRPSERLQQAIDSQLEALGEGYVSVSARFLGALGDFRDTTSVQPLPHDKQSQLIEACIGQIRLIQERHPGKTVLVNSDSTTFLAQAARLPNTYSAPGHILHLDVPSHADALYDTYEKTFLDFFLIAHASHVYRLTTRWMHSSGFPYAASLLYGQPFHSVDFKLS